MKKEEKIVIILLCMVLLSLAITYVTFFSAGSQHEKSSFSSRSLPGDEVYLEGNVVTKRFTYTGNHLLMNVEYGDGTVVVFIPSDSGAKDVNSRVNENDRISLTGTVQEYNEELEILIHNSNDINVLT